MPLPRQELNNIIVINSINGTRAIKAMKEELHRHEVQGRTGNIFKTYGTALYSAASMANSRIFKIVLRQVTHYDSSLMTHFNFSAIGVLVGSSILFCAIKSVRY